MKNAPHWQRWGVRSCRQHTARLPVGAETSRAQTRPADVSLAANPSAGDPLLPLPLAQEWGPGAGRWAAIHDDRPPAAVSPPPDWCRAGSTTAQIYAARNRPGGETTRVSDSETPATPHI